MGAMRMGGLAAALAVAGLCLGAGLRAGEGAPAMDREGPPPGPPEGAQGAAPREGGDRRGKAEGDRSWGSRGRGEARGRQPGGLPLLGDVKGMKEELEKHGANMKALRDQLAEVMGKPGDKPGDKPGEKRAGEEPQGEDARKEALKARVEQVAPAIIDEFIRHYQAVGELLKADREGAVEKLKDHMMKPGGPGGGQVPPDKGVEGTAPGGDAAGGGSPGGRSHGGRPGGR